MDDMSLVMDKKEIYINNYFFLPSCLQRPVNPVLVPQVTTGNPFFRFWGWNNEVYVFDTLTSAWSEPETHVSVWNI